MVQANNCHTKRSSTPRCFKGYCFSCNMFGHKAINCYRGNMKHIRCYACNKVMVQNNRMKESRTTDQNQEIEEREWFKKYTLVHLVQVAYTRELMEQKKHIRMHTLS